MSAFPSPPRRRPPRRRPIPPGRAETRVPEHRFAPDPNVPADHRDRAYCATCGCHGEPGDARHPDASEPEHPTLDDDARALEHRRLGEKGDDD